jgi:hypothetical protein
MFRASIIATAMLLTGSIAGEAAQYDWYPEQKVSAALALIDASGEAAHFGIVANSFRTNPVPGTDGKSAACRDARKMALDKMASTSRDGLVMTEVRIYITRFSIDEMNRLTKFFQNPAGRQFRLEITRAAETDPQRMPSLLYAPNGRDSLVGGKKLDVRDYLQTAINALSVSDGKTVEEFFQTELGRKFLEDVMREIESASFESLGASIRDGLFQPAVLEACK